MRTGEMSMEFKTEQQIISYSISGAGCIIIGFFSNPDGIGALGLILIGIILVGVGGSLQGSINK